MFCFCLQNDNNYSVSSLNWLVGRNISINVIRDKNAWRNKWSQHENGSQFISGSIAANFCINLNFVFSAKRWFLQQISHFWRHRYLKCWRPNVSLSVITATACWPLNSKLHNAVYRPCSNRYRIIGIQWRRIVQAKGANQPEGETAKGRKKGAARHAQNGAICGNCTHGLVGLSQITKRSLVAYVDSKRELFNPWKQNVQRQRKCKQTCCSQNRDVTAASWAVSSSSSRSTAEQKILINGNITSMITVTNNHFFSLIINEN